MVFSVDGPGPAEVIHSTIQKVLSDQAAGYREHQPENGRGRFKVIGPVEDLFFLKDPSYRRSFIRDRHRVMRQSRVCINWYSISNISF